MGISYFGASTPSRPLSPFYQLVLISWNAAAFAFSYYTFYVSTQPTSPSGQASAASDGSQHNSNSGATSSSNDAAFLGQKALTPLVDYIRFFSLFVYFCFSYILNLYMGAVSRSLIKLLRNDLYPLLDSEAEHRIGTGIALVQGVIIAMLSSIFQLLLYTRFDAIQWDRWLENILNMYSLSSPVTSIAYINFSIAHIIRTTGETGNLSLYIRRLMILGPVICRLSYLLGPAIFVVILNATIVCIASLCLLFADFGSTYFISVIGFLVFAVVLIAMVLVSSYAYETTKEVNSQFQERLYLAVCQAEEGSGEHSVDTTLVASQLNILTSLAENMTMSPFGIFHLHRSYITTFFSFMLSYSVILIQTSESSGPATMEAPKVQNQTNG